MAAMSAVEAHRKPFGTTDPGNRRVRKKGVARRNAAAKARPRRAADERAAGDLSTALADLYGKRAVANGGSVPLDAAVAAARGEVGGGGGGAWSRFRRGADDEEYNPADFEDGHSSPEVRRVRDGRGGEGGSRPHAVPARGG